MSRRSPGSPSQWKATRSPRDSEVAVEAVDADVQRAVREPLEERRVGAVAALRGRGGPGEHLVRRGEPERLRVGLGPVVEIGLRHRAGRELRGRRKAPVLHLEGRDGRAVGAHRSTPGTRDVSPSGTGPSYPLSRSARPARGGRHRSLGSRHGAPRGRDGSSGRDVPRGAPTSATSSCGSRSRCCRPSSPGCSPRTTRTPAWTTPCGSRSRSSWRSSWSPSTRSGATRPTTWSPPSGCACRRGILARREQTARFDRVQNVSISQSLMDRLLNVGAVELRHGGHRRAGQRLHLHRDLRSPVPGAHRGRELPPPGSRAHRRAVAPRSDIPQTGDSFLRSRSAEGRDATRVPGWITALPGASHWPPLPRCPSSVPCPLAPAPAQSRQAEARARPPDRDRGAPRPGRRRAGAGAPRLHLRPSEEPDRLGQPARRRARRGGRGLAPLLP